VHAHLAVGIDDADVHPVDVPIDAAVKRVLNRVESPRVPSVLRGMGRPQFVSTVFADTHLQRPSKEETWLLKFS
jgi:hypothetical protein